MYKDYNVQPNAIGVTVSKSKTERLMTSAPMIKAGNVVFPKQAKWLRDFEYELLYFENGAKHDDQVDSLSLYLNYSIENNYKPLNIGYIDI